VSEGKRSLMRARPTILMRLVAGCWFAVTGFIPAFVSFLVTSWVHHPIGSLVFVKSAIIPIPIFALCGAVIGAPILYESRGRPEYAALRGAAVAALSMTLYVLAVAIIETLRSMKPDLGGLIFITLSITVFWAAVRFVPILIIGALAGWLLYRCRFACLSDS
jgi:hypothetical protein